MSHRVEIEESKDGVRVMIFHPEGEWTLISSESLDSRVLYIIEAATGQVEP